MNKEGLIRAISHQTGGAIPQSKICLLLETTIDVITQALDQGEAVKWKGFGSLVLKDKQPRRIYSPSRKEYIVSKGEKKIMFVPSKKHRKN